MSDLIVNKVADSGLITLNLEEYYPQGERILFDIKAYLFQEIILKEKDFRAALQLIDWAKYKEKHVAIWCSTDAIVPTWAYMLVATYLEPYAKKIVFGNLSILETILFNEAISNIDLEPFCNERVIIKGCSHVPVPESAYVEITRLLKPLVKSLMFGEACSTVPLYKKR